MGVLLILQLELKITCKAEAALHPNCVMHPTYPTFSLCVRNSEWWYVAPLPVLLQFVMFTNKFLWIRVWFRVGVLEYSTDFEKMLVVIG